MGLLWGHSCWGPTLGTPQGSCPVLCSLLRRQVLGKKAGEMAVLGGITLQGNFVAPLPLEAKVNLASQEDSWCWLLDPHGNL